MSRQRSPADGNGSSGTVGLGAVVQTTQQSQLLTLNTELQAMIIANVGFDHVNRISYDMFLTWPSLGATQGGSEKPLPYLQGVQLPRHGEIIRGHTYYTSS